MKKEKEKEKEEKEKEEKEKEKESRTLVSLARRGKRQKWRVLELQRSPS